MHAHPPWRTLYTLWQQYWQFETLPQADRFLRSYFKANAQHGKRDRKWLSDWFFAGLRHALWAAICEKHWQEKQVATTDLLKCYTETALVLQRLQTLTPEIIFTWVALRIRYADEMPVNNHRAAYYAEWEASWNQQADVAMAWAWHSLPPTALPFAAARWPEPVARERWMNQQDSQPPMWLRLRSCSLQDVVLAELAQAGFTVVQRVGLATTLAVAVVGSRSLYESPSYENGTIEIQDLGSQRVSDVVIPAEKTPLLLDACAGGGGKTLHFAATAGNRGIIVAMDNRAYKLEELKRRARKAQFHCIRTQTWDWQQETLPPVPREVKQRGGFDWVLVDAPCSASGTWRRNPDAKWRFDWSTLPALAELQLSILRSAAYTVRSGGHLVYATCSFVRLENENVVERFIATVPGFRVELMHCVGAPDDNSDTLFVAVMARKEDAKGST